VVVLNSDTLVPREWLGRLEAALLARDDLGAAGPMSNYVSGPQLIPDLELHSMDAINAVSRRLHAEHGTATDDTARLVGFCMMVRDEAFRQVGLFDEAFGVGNCEDDDYCLRIMKAGWKLGVARGCFVFHYGHRTFTGMGLEGESFNALVRQNLDHLTTKWGFETALQSPQGAQAAELNGLGRAALERGDVDAAVDLLKRAVEACPVIATHHNDLGAALWKAGRQDMAFRCFANALRIQPDEPDARANLHDAAAAMDREEEAANVLREADARLKEAP
jgi:tetratricopeptide (TPR) repeat protein